MKAGLIYRIASILLLILAIGRTLGFRRADSKWGVARCLAQCSHSALTCRDLLGLIGTFLSALGSLSQLFSCSLRVFAWQLGGLPRETLYNPSYNAVKVPVSVVPPAVSGRG